MTALFNASVLKSNGLFRYEKITVEEDRKLLQAGLTSYNGHQSTCNVLSRLLEVYVPKQRNEYGQQIGEKALIFRLKNGLEKIRY